MLSQVLQASFLSIYRAVSATGVLNSAWGRSLFEVVYIFYKNHFEAGPIVLLQNWVKPETSVIDVGANIGFFTLKFANWVTGDGKVIALEPESNNCSRLRRTLIRARVGDVVEVINVAVADFTGEAMLEINPLHPGDHKLGSQGVPVTVSTIDHLLKVRGWPAVSLIKIDVQGAEHRVLAGAIETLGRFRPALFVEVDDQALIKQGSSARALLEMCIANQYTIHKLTKSSKSPCLTIEGFLQHPDNTRGYSDVLLLPAD